MHAHMSLCKSHKLLNGNFRKFFDSKELVHVETNSETDSNSQSYDFRIYNNSAGVVVN
jgi:hypothetical protein